MSTDTTQDTLIDRTVSAMTEAILEADSSATWLSHTAKAVVIHLAAELVVFEELAERPLSLQEALGFLCAGVEL